MLDWGWLASHVGAFADRTVQHVYLAAIALLDRLRHRLRPGPVGRPPAASVPADQRPGRHHLHAPQPRVLFAALIPITGITLMTAEVPLVLYTQVILIRNIVAGFQAVPSDVLEAADGMGYRSTSDSGGSNCPLPCRSSSRACASPASRPSAS